MTLVILFISTFLFCCQPKQTNNHVITGAAQVDHYIPLLVGKNVALVANQTSLVHQVHLVDTLLSRGINISKVFAPEHGFRGEADAGASIDNTIDTKTGLPILSLYGKNKKPSKEFLEDVDMVVFDIQDVGARFYTYISTLHYVMEACAENSIPVLVLDRPNPNAHYVDGPVLDTAFKSFVGIHPIPIVHGMTLAEYAQMINGENWLKDSVQCELYWQGMKNYDHQKSYNLPIKPSPNLPNSQSIALYPSLCLFEGTDMSVGRGTSQQFQVIGSPKFDSCFYSFTPISRQGAKYPKHENKDCCGWDLRDIEVQNQVDLKYLIKSYRQYEEKDSRFFNSFFDKLAGSSQLRIQIESGWTSDQIKQTWKDGLDAFKKKRQLYLIYP
tara:strand:+ start:288 stop:1439 length:1152 start_codon:yes stop_codon:yes gene_type:complete